MSQTTHLIYKLCSEVQAISAMISRTYNGMKEGLQMLGLPDPSSAADSFEVSRKSIAKSLASIHVSHVNNEDYVQTLVWTQRVHQTLFVLTILVNDAGEIVAHVALRLHLGLPPILRTRARAQTLRPSHSRGLREARHVASNVEIMDFARWVAPRS